MKPAIGRLLHCRLMGSSYLRQRGLIDPTWGLPISSRRRRTHDLLIRRPVRRTLFDLTKYKVPPNGHLLFRTFWESPDASRSLQSISDQECGLPDPPLSLCGPTENPTGR